MEGSFSGIGFDKTLRGARSFLERVISEVDSPLLTDLSSLDTFTIIRVVLRNP